MKTVFQGKLYTIKQGETKEETGERADRCPSIGVIPFTKEGKVILTREYRKEVGKKVISTVWGRVDKESDIETAAHRELAEEAKFKAKKMKLFYKAKPEDTLTWDRYMFVATGLEPTKAEADEDEDIEPFECTLNEACEYALTDFRQEIMAYTLLKLRHDLETGKFKLP